MKIFSIILVLILITTVRLNSQWIQQHGGTFNHLIKICFPNENVGYSIGPWGPLMKTTTGGQNWEDLILPFNLSKKSAFFLNSNLGWILNSEGLLKTTDGGSNWLQKQCPSIYWEKHDVFFITENIGWIVGMKSNWDSFVIKTTDGGQTWIEQYSVIHGMTLERFYALTFINPDTGWVVGARGRIIKTTNAGIDWIPLAAAAGWDLWSISYGVDLWSISFIDDSVGWIAGIGFDSGPGGYLASYGLILRTINGGQNWDLQGEFRYFELYGVQALSKEKAIAVGDSGYILITANGGSSWSYQNSGTSSHLSSITFTDSIKGWISGFDGTILHTTNGGVTFIEDENNFTQPKDFLLSQNYPNPFNPTTRIQYAVSNRQFVRLKVYDVLGKEVATLVNEEKPAGEYEVEFNPASGIRYPASGIYFYQLRSGSFVQTKKMLLLK
jgi:photosystem II stability/assembly factor-like uncharacterized protein